MEELLERTADPAMGLTVTLLYDRDNGGRTLLVVESETSDYHERREVMSGESALVAFHHPFSTFVDMPSPWTRATDEYDDDDDDGRDDDGNGNVVQRVNDYTSPNGGQAQ